jgi:hypothetical protein
MQTLIGQCFQEDPAERPSFNDIYRSLAAANFQILPDADRAKIQDFARQIRDLEGQ